MPSEARNLHRDRCLEVEIPRFPRDDVLLGMRRRAYVRQQCCDALVMRIEGLEHFEYAARGAEDEDSAVGVDRQLRHRRFVIDQRVGKLAHWITFNLAALASSNASCASSRRTVRASSSNRCARQAGR